MPLPSITLVLLPSGDLGLDRGPNLSPAPVSPDPEIAISFLYQVLHARVEQTRPPFSTPGLPCHYLALAMQGELHTGFKNTPIKVRQIRPGLRLEPQPKPPKILSTTKTTKQLGL